MAVKRTLSQIDENRSLLNIPEPDMIQCILDDLASVLSVGLGRETDDQIQNKFGHRLTSNLLNHREFWPHISDYFINFNMYQVKDNMASWVGYEFGWRIHSKNENKCCYLQKPPTSFFVDQISSMYQTLNLPDWSKITRAEYYRNTCHVTTLLMTFCSNDDIIQLVNESPFIEYVKMLIHNICFSQKCSVMSNMWDKNPEIILPKILLKIIQKLIQNNELKPDSPLMKGKSPCELAKNLFPNADQAKKKEIITSLITEHSILTTAEIIDILLTGDKDACNTVNTQNNLSQALLHALIMLQMMLQVDDIYNEISYEKRQCLDLDDDRDFRLNLKQLMYLVNMTRSDIFEKSENTCHIDIAILADSVFKTLKAFKNGPSNGQSSKYLGFCNAIERPLVIGDLLIGTNYRWTTFQPHEPFQLNSPKKKICFEARFTTRGSNRIGICPLLTENVEVQGGVDPAGIHGAVIADPYHKKYKHHGKEVNFEDANKPDSGVAWKGQAIWGSTISCEVDLVNCRVEFQLNHKKVATIENALRKSIKYYFTISLGTNQRAIMKPLNDNTTDNSTSE